MKSVAILLNPILTEKAMMLVKNNVYSFEVTPNATKHMVKKAVEDVFDAQVSSVTIMNRISAAKRYGKKGITKRAPNKKIAYVTVSKGTISVFPQA